MRPTSVFLCCAAILVLVLAGSGAAAQTLTVIHYFSGGADGAEPQAGLSEDAAGNFYGTTTYGGSTAGACGPIGGCGTVFKLKHNAGGWTFIPIYTFAGGNDGNNPYGGVTIARDGTLYGTTSAGGSSGCNGYGCGTVFHLTPGATFARSALSPWTKSIIYRFSGPDGEGPQGDLTFDQSGNIFGTTIQGGVNNLGAVYELTPSGSNWTESVVYSAVDPNGRYPYGGVVVDSSHNIFGTFEMGGSGAGTIFELIPSGHGWTEQTLEVFNGNNGEFPKGGLIQDGSGNIYGTTSYGGVNGNGSAFELTPGNGGWAFNLLSSFSLSGGGGPLDKLLRDAAGNLYGTIQSPIEGNENGSVFELTPSNGSWVYTPLWIFTGLDGAYPVGAVIFRSDGSLYGTTSGGGMGSCFLNGCGVVFMLTP